ncbi:unnamed protein product [Phytophthora fragariaefolia]|uniref:Unnamed protein product n=1 Tax=Phytophthora fragariaefolia TaxID=1490495 RepID=A0A9W6Y798_9STRA|nr:unnamed protein product [Phytophthora fragariaefolia]
MEELEVEGDDDDGSFSDLKQEDSVPSMDIESAERRTSNISVPKFVSQVLSTLGVDRVSVTSFGTLAKSSKVTALFPSTAWSVRKRKEACQHRDGSFSCGPLHAATLPLRLLQR